jgi:DNA-binding IclR family transcriptional regulator
MAKAGVRATAGAARTTTPGATQGKTVSTTMSATVSTTARASATPGAAGKPDSERYTVPGLERGLRLLREFSRSEPQLGAPELARRLELPRSAVFRLLVTLEQLGYVERTPDGRSYRLGLAVLRLGFETISSMGIVDLARPVLEALRDATGYASTLVVRDARDLVYLYRAAPRSPFASSVTVGTRLPVHATLMGQLLLSELSLPALRALYPEPRLKAYTAQTPATVRALFDQAQQARARGWVLAEGYFEAHIGTIGAAVHGDSGQVVAAIGMTMPGPQIAIERREGLIAQVVGAAEAISSRLNFQPSAVTSNDIA